MSFLLNPVAAAPYPLTSIGSGQLLCPVSATGFTSPPSGATYAYISAITATVSYTTDGQTTPTSTKGFQLAVGANPVLLTGNQITNFKAISTTGSVYAEFFY